MTASSVNTPSYASQSRVSTAWLYRTSSSWISSRSEISCCDNIAYLRGTLRGCVSLPPVRCGRPRGAPVIRTRRALAGIPNYVPGRSAEQVAGEHDLADVVKLASNEGPFPPLPAALDAIAAAAANANRYPDDGG